MAEVPGTRFEGDRLVFRRLALGSVDARGNGWYGMILLILSEACLFAFLLFSYYYMAVHHGRAFFPAELPSFKLSGPNTAILIASSVAVWFAEHSIKKGSRWTAAALLAVGCVLGIIFVAIQGLEWSNKPYTVDSDAHASLFFTVTGFHLAHVVGGLLILIPVTFWTAAGKFDRRRRDFVSTAAIYWHFVDLVWLSVFFTFYVTPYLFVR